MPRVGRLATTWRWRPLQPPFAEAVSRLDRMKASPADDWLIDVDAL
jgi:hypothetical protein